ncbi:DUF3278 domain-containing protein [Macrococcoides caseolyticum]|uniref:DUF3278 domain-containing protein n=1 Tax=Macrococcoides caseolyticum TaxID=69966 RepID=UPI00119D0682|nr:DUF3278 domain-containing protein [Macrococcus caseolyticus]
MKKLDCDYLSAFTGLDMTNDEYQRQQGYLILTNCFNYIFLLIPILLLGSLAWDSYHQIISAGTIIFFITQQVLSIFVLNHIRKTKVDISEYYTHDDYKVELKKVKLQSVKIGLYWGSTMYLLMEVLFKLISGEKYEFSWFNLLIWVLGGAFFGTMMYFVARTKIKKVTEDEVE